MRRTWTVILMAVLSAFGAVQAQEPKEEGPNHAAEPAKLYFVFLNRAPNAPTYSKEKSEEIQAGHMANIRRLYGEGKLEVAGPFMDDSALRGIFIFKASSSDQVKEWIASDPAVKAGRLVDDIHPWDPAKGVIHHPASDRSGMENFVMMIYHWGDKAKTTKPEDVQAAFQAHKKYQLGLFESGKTEIGGPFEDAPGGEYVGVVIAHGNKEEGEKLAAGDPVVQAGVARVEVHEWITAKGVFLH